MLNAALIWVAMLAWLGLVAVGAYDMASGVAVGLACWGLASIFANQALPHD